MARRPALDQNRCHERAHHRIRRAWQHGLADGRQPPRGALMLEMSSSDPSDTLRLAADQSKAHQAWWDDHFGDE
jgi:hypothetical protein